MAQTFFKQLKLMRYLERAIYNLTNWNSSPSKQRVQTRFERPITLSYHETTRKGNLTGVVHLIQTLP